MHSLLRESVRNMEHELDYTFGDDKIAEFSNSSEEEDDDEEEKTPVKDGEQMSERLNPQLMKTDSQGNMPTLGFGTGRKISDDLKFGLTKRNQTVAQEPLGGHILKNNCHPEDDCVKLFRMLL